MSNSFETQRETPEFETLASLAENVIYRVPGCSDEMVRKTLQDVYRDFCRRSCCLNGRRHFTITNQDAFVIVAPMYGGVIDCVTEVRCDRRILDRFAYRSHDGRVELSPNVIPRESETRELSVMFIEMPKVNSEQVPSWFVQRHGDAVVSGTMARLTAMLNRAWSDKQQAEDERIRYENAVNEERVRYYAQRESGDVGSAVTGERIV